MSRLRLRRPSPAMGVALVALFISLGGVSYGVATGSIDSREIRDNTIRSGDVRNSSLSGADVRNNSLTGNDVLESSLSQVPNARTAGPIGPAGGSLAGQYPNPTVAGNAITSGQIADNTVTGNDVLESSLGQVPTAATAAPSGPAGGDLTGTYPNPTIGANAVTGTEVTDDTLTGSDIDETTLSGLLRSTVYKRESAVVAGTDLADGTFVAAQACDAGDQILSGGPANVNPTSWMVESFPTPGSTNSWTARINKNAAADNWNVVVLCADQP